MIHTFLRAHQTRARTIIQAIAVTLWATIVLMAMPTHAQLHHHGMPPPPTYHGTILAPDPSNRATGYRNPREPCQVTVSAGYGQPTPTIYVTTSLAPSPAISMHPMPPATSFYAGDLPDGRVFVLQMWQGYSNEPPRPTSLTLTTRQPNGTINYGHTGTYIAECMLDLSQPSTHDPQFYIPKVPKSKQP